MIIFKDTVDYNISDEITKAQEAEELRCQKYLVKEDVIVNHDFNQSAIREEADDELNLDADYEYVIPADDIFNYMKDNNLQQSDMSEVIADYLTDTNNIVKEYRNNFESISMTYMADEKYEANNIFYAVIKVQFRHFINEEFFKVIAID